MGEGVREYDVALCGYFGFDNFGDEMLLASAVQNLLECGVPRERICVFSNAPEDTQKKFSIRSYDRWNRKVVRSALSRSRSLLFPGGGLFQDSTSVKSCLYYWGVARMAWASGCSVWALGQSVGPLSTFAGKWLTKNAMKRMDFLSVRDKASHDVLRTFGVDAKTMPDLVFGLQVPDVVSDSSGPFLVNIRPSIRNPESVRSMLAAIRSIAASGREVRGIAMSPEDARVFVQYHEEGAIPPFEVATPRSISEFAGASNGCAAAIGMRLHFAIFSLLLGLPVFVSAYDPKVSSFAENFAIPSLPDEGCADVFDFIMKTLTKARIHDKKSQRQLSAVVSRFFEEGLSCAMEKGPK